MTDRKVIDMPVPNRVLTINLGETLVAKGIRTTGQALEVSKLTKWKSAGEASIHTCAMSVNQLLSSTEAAGKLILKSPIVMVPSQSSKLNLTAVQTSIAPANISWVTYAKTSLVTIFSLLP